jgi:hypothetical protein
MTARMWYPAGLGCEGGREGGPGALLRSEASLYTPPPPPQNADFAVLYVWGMYRMQVLMLLLLLGLGIGTAVLRPVSHHTVSDSTLPKGGAANTNSGP